MSITQALETQYELSKQAKTIAQRLDMAQAADNYLDALLGSWDELADAERREEVRTALNRLRGSYA